MNTPGVNTSCEIALRWMTQNTFDDKLTLVYLSQAWPRTMLPYGITRPQQVIVLHNLLSPYDTLILQWFLAATKQLYDWFSPSVCLSVCLSVCPSVCHTFFTMFPSSYHHEIFRSYYQWQKWRLCKRSRSGVKGQGHRGQHPTWPFPDCNSSLNSHMMMKWCIQLDDA